LSTPPKPRDTSTSDKPREFGFDTVHPRWKTMSYDQAMQRGSEALSGSSTVPPRPVPGENYEHSILKGQFYALQATAWFAFARELREAGLGAGDPVLPGPNFPAPPPSS
jgi:hypothetical protein